MLENRARWQKGYTIDFSHSHNNQQRYLETVSTMKLVSKGPTCKKLLRREVKQKARPVCEKLFIRVAFSSQMAVAIIQLGRRFTSWVHPISISTISGCISIKSGADVHSTFMLPRGEANTAMLTCLWPQLCPALAVNQQILSRYILLLGEYTQRRTQEHLVYYHSQPVNMIIMAFGHHVALIL